MTPAIDITAAQRKTLLTLLRQFIPGVLVWAYGSRVKWTARPNSDLDLVAFTTPAQSPLVSELKEALAESNLPFPVDVHVWDEIPERFHKIIRNEYVVLQEAEEKQLRSVSEWREGTIADVAAPSKNALVGGPFGSNLVSRDYTPSGVPVIRGQNMGFGRWVSGEFVFVSEDKAKDLSANIARPGDLVFTQRGTLGQVAIVPPAPFDRYIISQSQMKLTADPAKADTKFLFYFFNSQEQQDYIRRNAIQTGVPHTNLGHLRTTPLLLPPLSEQRAITAVLGSLDDKIELNRRMNETLEALAQSLFKSCFVDATQTVLPKGWRSATIAELCETNSWTLGKGDELDRIEYVEISEVMRGNIANIQSYERGEEPSRARRRLRHGDTVLSTVRPDRGAYFLCLNPSPNLIGSTGFAVLTPTKAPWSFIHAAMTQTDVFEYLGQQADGGAYPAVRPEIIGALEVPWPNKPEMVEAFHQTCAPLYERAELNREESRTLAALRDALLPKLLSGELRVADVEAVVHNPERQTV